MAAPTPATVPSCDGGTDGGVLVDSVAYCPSTNTIVYDRATLQQAHYSVGDFAAGCCSPPSGRRRCSTTRAPLGTDAARGARVHDRRVHRQPRRHVARADDDITLSPGDLDEVISMLVAPTPRRDRGTAFSRVSAFRTGYFQGPAPEVEGRVGSPPLANPGGRSPTQGAGASSGEPCLYPGLLAPVRGSEKLDAGRFARDGDVGALAIVRTGNDVRTVSNATHAAEHAECARDAHGGVEAAVEATPLPTHCDSGRRRQHRHREQAGHPGDRVVDRRRGPAWWSSTAASTAAVSGATVIASPRPSTMPRAARPAVRHAGRDHREQRQARPDETGRSSSAGAVRCAARGAGSAPRTGTSAR